MKEQTEKRTTETEQPKQNNKPKLREQPKPKQSFKGYKGFKGFQYIKRYIIYTTEKIQQQPQPQNHKTTNFINTLIFLS